MFCMKCGAELPDEAVFCFKCGTKVASENDKDTTVNGNLSSEIVEKEESTSDMSTNESRGSKGISFKIGKHSCSFGDEVIRHNDYFIIVREEADAAYKQACNYWDNSIKSLTDILSGGYDFANDRISDTLDACIKQFYKNGINEISQNELRDRCGDQIDIDRYFGYFYQKGADIEDAIDQIAAKRGNAIARRGQWVGGGFGLKGAIKGSITAGALNLGTSAMHGVGDAVRQSWDKAKISNMNERIAKDPEAKEVYTQAIKQCCLDITEGFFSVLEEKGLLPYYDFDVSDEITKYDNAVKFGSDDEKISAILGVLNKNPYAEWAYIELFNLDTKLKKSIQKMAKYFNYGLEVETEIEGIINDDLSHIQNLPEKTEKECEHKISELTRVCKLYGISRDEDIAKLADKKKGIAEKAVLRMPESNEKELKDKLSALKKLEKAYPDVDVSEEIKRISKNVTELKEVGSAKEDIDKAIKDDIESVWELAEHKNAYAAFALEKYYSNKYKAVVDNHSFRIGKATDIASHRNGRHPLIGTYIEEYLMYKTIDSNKDRDARPMKMTICGLAEKGLPIAMGLAGFWMVEREEALSGDGRKYLTEGAKLGDPTAMAWLGTYYKTGRRGFVKDNEKGDELLHKAAELGQLKAINTLKQENGGTSSSGGCYITTAVCEYFGKPDDCYELDAFRRFRDTWLANEVGGQEQIKEYYATAPHIVDAINASTDRDSVYKRIWSEWLLPCLNHIERKENNLCREKYTQMVTVLKQEFLGGSI